MWPLDHAPDAGRLVAIAPRPVGRLRMPGLLVRGALGRLGEAEDVDAFAFRRMTVRAPLLSGLRRLKVATDGEVCRMALPLRFEALDGRLALLVPDAEEGADTAAAAR
jgi:hypothetical protein